MAKKIKKRANSVLEVQDPELEEVDENRQFEIEEDEETNEVIFVHHYRRRFGDNFEADVEHAMNYEEAGEMVGIVTQIMDRIQSRVMLANAVGKIVPESKEGNPLQGPNNLDGK